MKAQREAWGEALTAVAVQDQRIIVLDGDLATSTRADIFAEAHPDRFFQIGIAEQNLVGMAFGMSTLGYRPWVSSLTVFLTHRALDPLRMLVAQTHAPVRIASSYAGLLTGATGKTHQDVEDLAIMRAMPGMTVLAPADAGEVEAMVGWAADHPGPVYLRLARDPVAEVVPAGLPFVLGEVRILREGTDAVLVSTGVQSSRVVDAAELLDAQGVHATVVHVPCLKPIDSAALLHAVSGRGPIFTVEEHSVLGGLGGLVSELLTSSGYNQGLVRIGLADGWAESAPNEFLLEKYGLSAARVAARVASVVAPV